MKSFLSRNICLTLVTIQRIQSFFDPTNKTVIGKMKDEFGRVIVGEFVELKSKIHSMKKIDNKESNTAKGVNIIKEFNEFKDVLFNKKIIRLKMRRLQSKKHKLGTCGIDKLSLSCFNDKRYVLDDAIHTLAYFHKDSVTNCKKIKKDCDKKERIEKDCDKKDCEEIKKDCDKKRIKKACDKKDCEKTSC